MKSWGLKSKLEPPEVPKKPGAAVPGLAFGSSRWQLSHVKVAPLNSGAAARRRQPQPRRRLAQVARSAIERRHRIYLCKQPGREKQVVGIDRQANLPRDSYVQIDNLQTVSKTRFVKYIGALDPPTMRTIARKIVLALGLEDAV